MTMRVPIKLSDAFWPRALARVVGPHLRTDPRILLTEGGPSPQARTQAISAFKFGTTFKTTAHDRHREADELLIADGVDRDAVILDVGASDGITSLNLIDRLGEGFGGFFVTDYNLSVTALRRGHRMYFFDHRGTCVLVADPLFVYYPEDHPLLKKAMAPLVRLVAGHHEEGRKIQLIHPALAARASSDPRIRIRAYDVLEPWTDVKPTIIKVANVLNPAYFSSAVIRRALTNLYRALPPGGRLLLIENRAAIQGGLFRRGPRGFEPVAQLRRSDIHELVVAPYR